MIICMLNDSFYRGSGSAIAIRRISEAVKGVEFYFAGTGDRQPEDLSWMPLGHYQQFDLKTLDPLRVFRELRRFKEWIRHIRCDLVHCHHRRLTVLLQLAGLRVLYTGHNAFPKSAWFRWLRPISMTAVTPSVAANLRANTGSEVIAVIGNPTPFPDTPPAIDLQTVRTRAVCVARLDPVKGHKYLLAAWKLLSDRGYECELDLVGEGPLREELEAQAQRDGIQHSVRFLGFSADVRSIVEKSLFAILASETEGQGLVTVEAAAAGRPSLLTLVAGSVDLLPPDRKLTNGVAFGHPMELAHALEEWFTNAADVVREGQLFFTFLKASGDAGKIAEEYKTVYRTLSAGNTACGL